MDLLAIADIHGAFHRLAALQAEISNSDLVLIAGDLTDFGGAEELRGVFEGAAFGATRVFAVPGNCDRQSARDYLSKIGVSIDGGIARAGDLAIVGSGGGLVRNGLTPYERHEEEFRRELRKAMAELDHGSPGPVVVLSHTPPQASGADSRRGTPTGSTALRKALDHHHPLVWICGHIHESPSAQLVDRTLVVNPGPLSEGRFARIRIECVAGLWQASAVLASLAEGY
jgi:Icc-related predicted phosphoesterase